MVAAAVGGGGAAGTGPGGGRQPSARGVSAFFGGTALFGVATFDALVACRGDQSKLRAELLAAPAAVCRRPPAMAKL